LEQWRGPYRALVGKFERKRTFGKLTVMWGDNIMDLRKKLLEM
jgi:hypothetical protein